MKHLLALLLLLLAGAAHAQRIYSPDFAIGLKGGATLGRMSMSPSIEQTWQPGFIAGIAARYTEENHFGLIAELNIEQRGWREAYEDGEPFSYARTLTYLQLPLLTHIYFGSPGARVFVNLGPAVAYMLNDRISANFDYRNIAAVEGYPRGYRTNEQLALPVSSRFDYGIAGGLGFELRIRRRHSFMLEGRYYYGLGNIFPARKRDYFGASRGMSIQITAAYLFRVR